MPLTEMTLAEIRVLGVADGQAIVNTFYLGLNPPSGNPARSVTLTGLLASFATQWQTFALPQLSSSYSVQRYEARSIIGRLPPALPLFPRPRVSYDDFALQAGVLPADQGTVVGEVLPTYVAVSIQRRTNLVGRQNRGAFRLSPIVEADTTFNALTAGAVSDFQGVGTALGTATPAIGLFFYEFRIFRKTALLAATGTVLDMRTFSTKITSIIVNPFVGSQISRKRSSSLTPA